MGFKKIVVNSYDKNDKTGVDEFRLKMTLTTKDGIEAKDAKEARQKVMAVAQRHTIGNKCFTVEWTRNGIPEGYMVRL